MNLHAFIHALCWIYIVITLIGVILIIKHNANDVLKIDQYELSANKLALLIVAICALIWL